MWGLENRSKDMEMDFLEICLDFNACGMAIWYDPV